MHVLLTEGRIIGAPIVCLPLLHPATLRQPERYEKPMTAAQACLGRASTRVLSWRTCSMALLPGAYRNIDPSSGVTCRAMMWLACCSGM